MEINEHDEEEYESRQTQRKEESEQKIPSMRIDPFETVWETLIRFSSGISRNYSVQFYGFVIIEMKMRNWLGNDWGT